MCLSTSGDAGTLGERVTIRQKLGFWRSVSVLDARGPVDVCDGRDPASISDLIGTTRSMYGLGSSSSNQSAVRSSTPSARTVGTTLGA
jgi:hypothetical protein